MQEFLERARNKIQRARTGLRERWRFTGKLREGGGGEEEYKIKGRTIHPSNKDLPNNKKKKKKGRKKKEKGLDEGGLSMALGFRNYFRLINPVFSPFSKRNEAAAN